MAHHVHDALHWAGQRGVDTWADVQSVWAELYRAHDIESFDTSFVKATTSEGIELRLACSHACHGGERHREWVICDDAIISCEARAPWQIAHRDGRIESMQVKSEELLAANLGAYFAYVRGEAGRPPTFLTDSRPFVELCDLAFVAAKQIHQIPEAVLARVTEGEDVYLAIDRLRDTVDRFFAEDLLPSEQGVTWGAPGGSASRNDLPRLHGVVADMQRPS